MDTIPPTTQPEMSDKPAIIVAGGGMHTSPIVASGTIIIAADSGYDHAVAAGLDVDLLIGDLDSISSEGLVHATNHGVCIERHGRDKDHNDLELAVRAALTLGATSIEIHGGEDGRIAHLLGVALGMATEIAGDVPLSWHTRTGVVRVVSPSRPLTLDCAVGNQVSIIPIGDATGVATSGLRWSLVGDDLPSGSSRGLSNESTDPHPSVTVEAGYAFVVLEDDV